MNAAVWFGAAIFFTLGGADPANAPELGTLLGAKNAPFFTVAIGQLVATRHFHLYLACSAVALLHMMAEWLYFGRYPTRLWLGLVFSLCFAGLVQSYWLQPRLKEWHRVRYSTSPQREPAARAFDAWHAVSSGLDLVLVGGLAVYLWRVANPPDPARFVSANKFRS
jgi:hypothetical protein